MSQERAPRRQRWKTVLAKLTIAAALLLLIHLAPVAGTVGLLIFLAAVVKPASRVSGRS